VSDAVIRTHKLRKVYRSGFLRKKHVGLAGLDLEVRRGEVLGYIGPNGAGKTTTIKLLLGLNFPSSGSAEILGKPLGAIEPRGRIGYLPERPYFYDYLTAEEFLHFYGQLHGMDSAQRNRRIDELLPLVQMEHARKTQLRKFSKGMLQRVGVAQALINEPELVVLDEPSSGLDPMGRVLIRDAILSLRKKGTTVLLSSHILSDVESVADRVAIITDGELRKLGTTAELIGNTLRCVEVTFEGLSEEGRASLGDISVVMDGPRTTTVAVDSHDAASHTVRQGLQAGARLISVVPQRQTLEHLFVEQVTSHALTPVAPPEDPS